MLLVRAALRSGKLHGVDLMPAKVLKEMLFVMVIRAAELFERLPLYALERGVASACPVLKLSYGCVV